MLICRVLGPVVSTVKHPCYRGEKLLMVQRYDPSSDEYGGSFVAVDRAQSGPGDLVLVMQEGNGVRQIFGQQILPIRSLIVGHIDEVDLPSYAP